MRLIVLGHARSGTGYAAHCFRRAGLDVQHEKLGRDGIASWMWAVPADEVPWGEPRAAVRGDEVIVHLMREPAAAVSSIAFTEQESEGWRRQWVLIPFEVAAIERAVWSYYGWNRLIAEQEPTHSAQIEHIERAVEEITGCFPHGTSVIWRNERPHRSLCADEIKATPWLLDETAVLWDRVCAQYEGMAR